MSPHLVHRRYARHACATSALALVGLAGLFFGAVSCSKASDSKTSDSQTETLDAGPPEVTVPGYPQVRLGMPAEELATIFPRAGATGPCAPRLVGSEPARPTAQDKPTSRCADILDLAGKSAQELSSLAEAVVDLESGDRAVVLGVALVSALGQVRGSVRAGSVADKDVLAAVDGTSGSPAALLAAMKLIDGARAFARIKNSRRSICAVLQEDCSNIDADKLRDYALNGWSYGKIDGLARQRCGPCRGKYVAEERSFQLVYVSQARAFAGLGLARAGRSEPLDPEDPKGYGVYKSRSKLDAATARLGVLLANAVPATEKFWEGSVLLDHGKTGDKQWGDAIVWLRDGKVWRVLLNIQDASKLDGLPGVVAAHFGSKPVEQGTLSTWTFAGGQTARLDTGVALSLVLTDK